MGGFGAYDIALHHPGRFCAVGGHSPALWLAAEDTAPGAFDDAEDFEANDVIATSAPTPAPSAPIPIWNDAGTEDPFLISDVAFDEALRRRRRRPHRHTPGPAGTNAPTGTATGAPTCGFYARALANC